MSLIFIECLFLSACLIFLMGINPFVKNGKILYCMLVEVFSYFDSFVRISLFFEVQLSFYLIAVFSLFLLPNICSMNLVSRKPSLEKTKIHLFLAAKAVSLNSIIHVIISWFWGVPVPVRLPR